MCGCNCGSSSGQLIGKKAPSFEAKAVVNGQIVEGFSLKQYLEKRNVVFFFYPKDFTFVCPTELHAFQDHIKDFERRDTVVVGCSTDSEYSHFAWLQTPKKMGGIQGVQYPLIADINKTIAAAYGVLAGEYYWDEDGNLQACGELVAFRGLFLIDKKGIVQHQVINNMALGRSVKETLRMLDALQHFEKHGEVCPIDWQKGEKALRPTSEEVGKYLSR